MAKLLLKRAARGISRITDTVPAQGKDRAANRFAVDMPIEVLLGKAPRMTRDVRTVAKPVLPLSTGGVSVEESLDRLLCLPTIADKSFLITIGDRSVGGLISRDQMVGPWQVPVADAAVSLSDYRGYTGEAMAMGERAPAALLNAPASGRLAVGEAITNIAAADVRKLQDIRLSANWMAACGEPGEDADLYATVRAVGAELCTALGITIPVGKDSLSMRTAWSDANGRHAVVAPVSLIISAFAPVADARRTLTPELDMSQPSRLLLVDLGGGRNRLGGSCWAQVFERRGGEPADLHDPALLLSFFAAVRELKDRDLLLAYHDRSDGGMLVSLLEMAFATHCGLEIDLGAVADPIAASFCEELGAVLQVPSEAKRHGARGTGTARAGSIDSRCRHAGRWRYDYRDGPYRSGVADSCGGCGKRGADRRCDTDKVCHDTGRSGGGGRRGTDRRRGTDKVCRDGRRCDGGGRRCTDRQRGTDKVCRDGRRCGGCRRCGSDGQRGTNEGSRGAGQCGGRRWASTGRRGCRQERRRAGNSRPYQGMSREARQRRAA